MKMQALRRVRQNLTGIIKFRSAPDVEQSFSKNLHSMACGPLAFGVERSYLAVTYRHLPMLASFNQQERTEDDPIDYLHYPCRLLPRTHQPAGVQTLARDLSLETNVTRCHAFVSVFR
jgi:hypothetical protein